MTASVENIKPEFAEHETEWLIDGKVVEIGDTYTVKSEDIGKYILRVSAKLDSF